MTFEAIVAEAVETTRRLARRSNRPEVAAVAEAAASHVGADRALPPNACPLGGAAAMLPDDPLPETAPLVDAFRASFAELRWFRNAVVPSEFVKRSAAAELIGPDGGIPSDELRFGLFLIAPDASYVRHWHAAEEHYMLLAGSAEWDLDDGGVRYRPGDVVQVASMTPHSIRTGASAVLTLYSWVGDLTFDTYGTDDPDSVS